MAEQRCDSVRREPPAVRIERAPEATATGTHDLIVIGGGIYGIALTLEAARRGLHVVLVERDDFAGATSWSSLRILHGGLRYLQSLDLARFYESVGERTWFLRHFPDLVRPLPCLMPLYGRRLKRPAILRAAMALNDLLSWRRNAGVASDLHLPRSRSLSASETAALFPDVDRAGLQGGALWHDAVMLSPERIAIEMLRWACACGANALNYVEAKALLADAGHVRGIVACDCLAKREMRLHADTVIDATGPWSDALLSRFGVHPAPPFRPALAFNLLLKRPPGAAVALAVEPRDTAQTYFLLPWRGLVMAGTSYAPLAEGHLDARPSAQQIEAFLADLNRAIPGLNVNLGDVLRVYAGLLPANTSGTVDLASRETIHDHGAGRGPQGLFSVRGVKYTTARLVAQKALIKALGKALPPVRADAVRPPPALIGQGVLNEASPLDGPADRLAAVLRELAAQEAVMCLDDLLMRRIDSTLTAQDPDAAARARGLLGPDLPDVVG